MIGEVRRLGLSAAVVAFALTAGACTGSQASAGHSCGALDKRFIQTAGLNMTALGIWASAGARVVWRNGVFPGALLQDLEDMLVHVGPALMRRRGLI